MLPILLDHNASIDFSKAETGATPFDAALGTRHPLTECARILADREAEDDKQLKRDLNREANQEIKSNLT